MTTQSVLIVLVIVSNIVAVIIIANINTGRRRHKLMEAFHDFDDIMARLESCKTKNSLAETREQYDLFLCKWGRKLTSGELNYFRTDFYSRMSEIRKTISR